MTRRLAVHNLLRDVVYHWANTALRNDPVSEAKYRALHDRGHGHHRALRTVADRLLLRRLRDAARRDRVRPAPRPGINGACSASLRRPRSGRACTSGPGVVRVSPAAAPARPGRPNNPRREIGGQPKKTQKHLQTGEQSYEVRPASFSKYSRVTWNTIGASSSRPIRLGIAISPLSVSDRFQTKSTLTLANASAASTHRPR